MVFFIFVVGELLCVGEEEIEKKWCVNVPETNVGNPKNESPLVCVCVFPGVKSHDT